MAIWAQIYGTDLWSAAVTKINNVIGSYNNWSGGSENQRKVKASATDFDTAWCDPEAKINSSTSFNLFTLLVGDSKSIALPYHSYSAEGNIAIKAYSLANPLNYIIGNITAIPNNQNITVTIVEKGGSGIQTDMVVIPYGIKFSRFYQEQTTTFTANDVFQALSLSNATFSSLVIQAHKRENQVTLNGNIAITATANIPIVRLALNNKYFFKNGNAEKYMFSSNALLNNSGTYSNINSICNNISVGNTSSSLLSFSTFNTVSNGNVINFYFSITYISESYTL